jgi:3-isopropylmalate/(R)-2-methylmalate dehydratase large subunit
MGTEIKGAGGDKPRTLAEKVWDDHVVVSGSSSEGAGAPDLIYIDLHLVHEVTSPQAFDGLRLAGRPVRRPDLTLATEDHNVPTIDIDKPIADPVSRTQVETLRRIRCPAISDGRYRTRHRACRRAAIGADPTGNDDRLRR